MEQIQNDFTFLEIRHPEVKIPPSLKDLIVLCRTNASITQLLINDKRHSMLQELVKPFSPEDVTMRGLSLKELFLFLTKDKIISHTQTQFLADN